MVATQWGHVVIPGICEYFLIWNKGLRKCNYVKDLEITLVTWMNPKAKGRWVYIHREENRHRGNSHMETKAERE